MHFQPPPPRPGPAPGNEHPVWRWLLFASATAGAICSLLPWLRVRFESLFGSHQGPPGWHTSAGITCLCTTALVAVMALAESGTPTSQQAARPGSLILVAVTTLVLGIEWSNGPGTMRGVSASWTGWFYLLLVSLPVLLLACTRRWHASAARSG